MSVFRTDLLFMLHRKFSITTEVPLCRSNQYKLENMKKKPIHTHTSYLAHNNIVGMLIMKSSGNQYVHH